MASILEQIMSQTYLIIFYAGIAKLMCRCNIGFVSVVQCFGVTETLTSALSYRKLVSGAYLLHNLSYESQNCYVDTSWGKKSHNLFPGLCKLTS